MWFILIIVILVIIGIIVGKKKNLDYYFINHFILGIVVARTKKPTPTTTPKP
jgi:hypothetical protein